jgi:hypothetical protein
MSLDRLVISMPLGCLLRATRLDLADSLAQALKSDPDLILQLEIHPEFLGHIEKASQANRGIRRDPPPFEHNIIDARSRDVDTPREFVRGQAHGLEEFFPKDLAGMNCPGGNCIFLEGHGVYPFLLSTTRISGSR